MYFSCDSITKDKLDWPFLVPSFLHGVRSQSVRIEIKQCHNDWLLPLARCYVLPWLCSAVEKKNEKKKKRITQGYNNRVEAYTQRQNELHPKSLSTLYSITRHIYGNKRIIGDFYRLDIIYHVWERKWPILRKATTSFIIIIEIY
jgi:hypothetical protein